MSILHSRMPASRRLSLCVGVICATLSAAPALAQQDPQSPRDARTLDTILVTADALDRDDSRQKTVSTATKMDMAQRDIPQTINTLEMSKSKVYGLNDLSVLLDGTPGIDTAYDTRGDGITIRGFAADSNDIYRDGIRNAGQIRRSTANVDRIEIVKGPASVLYGRGLGGGVVNLISKQASFDAVSSVNLRAGSWGTQGSTVDVNRILNPNVVVRLTADYEQADSFRSGISNRNRMLSPSILFDNGNGLSWLAQYTYDHIRRRPDRAPAFNALPEGMSIRTAYAHPDDFIEDEMESFRSVLDYRISDDWAVKWTAAWNKSSQDFDHLYAGTYCRPDGTLLTTGRPCTARGLMTFTRAWQETSNQTISNTVDLSGRFMTGRITHDVLLGVENSREQRNPDLSTSAASSDPGLLYPYGVDPYDPVWTQPKTPRGDAKTSNRHSADAQALYVQDLIGVSEQWKVLAGARFDRFEFTSLNRITGQRRSYDGSTLSPRLGVVWQPTQTQSVYASYSKNFAPYGGRGLMSVAVAEDAVFDAEPQYSRQYETGLKSDWLDGRLSSQLSVYELELYNIRYRPDPENDPFTWAVRGRERSRGIEASLAGRLASGWYLRGGVGLQEAKVTEDTVTPANEDKYKLGVARKTGNLFVRYAPEGPWYGELGVTYRGPIYNDAANTSERAGYTRWDASVGWRLLPWTLTVAVTNLTDTRYWRSTSMPGAPRGLLLSANYIF
ncbi:TonB-dependent receptor [Luteimonas sp. RIT-PG2_3]